MIRHQFGQVEFASEQWFRLAAATLAGSTHAAGLATAAKPAAGRVRRIDIVSTGPRNATLVLVLAEGPVQQVLLQSDGRPRKTWTGSRERSTRRWPGARRSRSTTTWRGSRRDPSLNDPLAVTAMERIVQMVHEFDASAVEDVFSEGLLNVMEAPEFARSEKLRRVFEVLQDRQYLGALMLQLHAPGDVHVFIGRETGHEEMDDVALVLVELRPAGTRDGRARRPRADAHGLPTRDQHRSLRERSDERARRPPVCLSTRLRRKP